MLKTAQLRRGLTVTHRFQGVYRYKSGEVYDGGWVKGKKCGLGKFVFSSGDIYEGDFKDDDITGPFLGHDRLACPG